LNKLKVAIIGYGGIARVHNAAYKELVDRGYPVSIVAVCERDFSRIKANLNFNLGNCDVELPDNVHLYSDLDEMIGNEDFDIADVCLPTFLHKDASIKLLRAGKHVLVEKPMALCGADCDEMLRAASESSRRLMVAHCLRFDPPYVFLKNLVDSGSFGALDNLYMYRHSVYPTWGTSFDNNLKTGGCTLDTHVHDLDIARFILGNPASVAAFESIRPPMYQVVTSMLRYNDTTVIADCSWDSTYSKSFRSGYRARFEKGSVVYLDQRVTVIPSDGEPYDPNLESVNYTEQEIEYFLNLVRDEDTKNTVCPPEESADSTRLAEKVRLCAAEKTL
jgi:predicted dehydrogenase